MSVIIWGGCRSGQRRRPVDCRRRSASGSRTTIGGVAVDRYHLATVVEFSSSVNQGGSHTETGRAERTSTVGTKPNVAVRVEEATSIEGFAPLTTGDSSVTSAAISSLLGLHCADRVPHFAFAAREERITRRVDARRAASELTIK